jgi:hypothetical protein
MALGYPYDSFGGLGLGQMVNQQHQAQIDYERSRREWEAMQNLQRAYPVQGKLAVQPQAQQPKESELLVLLTGE